MARTRINKKLLDGARLIRSFRTPEVRKALGPVGLSDEEIERGNELMAEARSLQQDFTRRLQHTPVVSELVGWQKRRFPVIRAILNEHTSDLERSLFEGTDTKSEPKVLYSVELVCSRLLGFSESTKEPEIAAWKELERHTITKDEIAGVLAKTSDEAPFVVTTTHGSATIEERDAAVAKLHAFRKKWAQIARAMIDDGMLLRAMGARGSRTRDASEDEAAPDPDEGTDGAS